MVEVRNLPVATKLFGVFDGFKGCAAGFEASNPVSLPRACPCSARACLDPLSLDSVGCCGSPASEPMMAHIHRLTVLLLTHVRRSRGPHVSCVEPRSGDAVARPRERGGRVDIHGGAHV